MRFCREGNEEGKSVILFFSWENGGKLSQMPGLNHFNTVLIDD